MSPLLPQERVKVHGLSGRPELNGQLGTVLLPLDASTGRYCVRVRRQLERTPIVGDDGALCSHEGGSLRSQPIIDDVKLKRSNLGAMPIPTVAPEEAQDGSRGVSELRVLRRAYPEGLPRAFHAIHDAAIQGDVHAVEQHLKSGVDPDLLDSHGWTPLMRACLWAHVEVVQTLLASGATPDIAVRKTRSTALHFVCMHGPRNVGPTGHYDTRRHELTAESLLAYGAQKNLGNAKGETPSMWARERGAAEILKMLDAAEALAQASRNPARSGASLE